MDEGSTNPRGPWLRSNSYGRRINDKRDSRFNSDPMKSMSGGNFSPVPKGMLEMLARMTLEEKTRAAATQSTKDDTEKGKSSYTGTSKTQDQGQNSSKSHQQKPTALAGLLNKASQGQ
jgi:hypothetical protein